MAMKQTLEVVEEVAGKVIPVALELGKLLLAHDDKAFEKMTIPEWGGHTVGIQSVSIATAEAFAKSARASVKAGDVNTSDVALTMPLIMEGVVHPETREKLFTDNAATRASFLTKHPGVISRIVERICEISAMTPKAVATTEKNS
jgi:hypothetical protein